MMNVINLIFSQSEPAFKFSNTICSFSVYFSKTSWKELNKNVRVFKTTIFKANCFYEKVSNKSFDFNSYFKTDLKNKLNVLN